MRSFLSQARSDLLSLLYPSVCLSCRQDLIAQEMEVCATCLSLLPRTKFHLQINNPLEQKFFGLIPFEYATAIYYFNKDSVLQDIMHAIKYEGNKDIAHFIGRRMAHELESCSWLNDIDLMVPIPLHSKKEKTRGYNQSQLLAEGFTEVIPKSINNSSVKRIKNTKTQTSMTRSERMDNVKDVFEVVDNKLNDMHILLIDDVVTTGATLASCANAILAKPNTKLSILTMAYAIE